MTDITSEFVRPELVEMFKLYFITNTNAKQILFVGVGIYWGIYYGSSSKMRNLCGGTSKAVAISKSVSKEIALLMLGAST